MEVIFMRLLIAEDEKDLADALAEILTLNKFSVDVVYNGQEALEYLDGVTYDGVILDIMMPKVNGIAVLKTLRKLGNNTPVLMLTAKSEIDDKVLGLDSGADDYLTKPFATKELLARIRAMTRREKEVQESDLKLGNIVLSRVTFELSSSQGSFNLTNKEYQLMEMLLNNVGRYISSQMFMDKIWGYDSESEINVVWAHLSGLRKKLESLGATFEIKSSRNFGYTLKENV
jgi:two-component system, OmpR family, response regulator ArlR